MFPSKPKIKWGTIDLNTKEIIEFEEGIRETGRKVKKNKAAGRDRILPKITKLLVKEKSKQLTKVFNGLLRKGKFTKERKTGRLVSIKKQGNGTTDGQNKYRPKCLLKLQS